MRPAGASQATAGRFMSSTHPSTATLCRYGATHLATHSDRWWPLQQPAALKWYSWAPTIIKYLLRRRTQAWLEGRMLVVRGRGAGANDTDNEATHCCGRRW